MIYLLETTEWIKSRRIQKYQRRRTAHNLQWQGEEEKQKLIKREKRRRGGDNINR